MKFLEELAARRRFGMKLGLEAIRALCAALEEGAEMIMASLALLTLLQSYLLFVHKNEVGEQNHL